MGSRAVQARISALIKAKRRESDIGLREAAEACHVSPSTLSRLERGASASLPDTETLKRLASWLGLTLEQLLKEDTKTAPRSGTPTLSVPETVQVHLRADKNLAPETAEALATMFQLLYEQFRRQDRGHVQS